MRLVLSEDEVDKLNTLSLDDNIVQVINDTIELVSETWRGAMRGKGLEIDPRDGYIPSAYRYWVLVHARYACWSRFPNSSVIAIDDVRKKEYEQALEILKSPFLNTDNVDWTDPALSGYVDAQKGQVNGLMTPWLQFPDEYPYIDNYKPYTMRLD